MPGKAGRVCVVQQKMWKIMRSLATFTTEDVATLSGASIANTKRYMGVLKRCGYLRNEGRAVKSANFHYATYRLIKNTGVEAPQLRISLYDPNINEIMK